MPRAMKPRDQTTGEMMAADLAPETHGVKPAKHGAERASLSVKLATERHRRLMLQNEKLVVEQRVREGELVELAVLQRQVVACNITVRQLLLALPGRLAPELVDRDAQQIRARLHQEITSALNALAFHGQGT